MKLFQKLRAFVAKNAAEGLPQRHQQNNPAMRYFRETTEQNGKVSLATIIKKYQWLSLDEALEVLDSRIDSIENRIKFIEDKLR